MIALDQNFTESNVSPPQLLTMGHLHDKDDKLTRHSVSGLLSLWHWFAMDHVLSLVMAGLVLFLLQFE